jgi:hypothetical protein
MTRRCVQLVATLTVLALSSAASAGKPKSVVVTNFPATQGVSGTVAVSNLPGVQDVNVIGGCSAASWLAGFTAAQFTGNQGFLSLASACVAEFPGSRVCSTRDVARTSAVPNDLSGTAWLLAEPLATSGTLLDGVSAVVIGFAQTATCNAWSQGAGATGLLIDAQGRFRTDDCALPRSVACCIGP